MLRLGTPEDAVQWLKSRVRGQLRVDSRQIQPGDGFIAWPGAAHDGRQFVKAALAKGAEACLVEHDGIEAFDLADPAVAAYQDLKVATGPIAAGFYGQPSRALQVVAVTGTNGKTSTAWWLAQALSRLPAPWTCRSGVVGTLGTGFPPEVTHNGLTTPDPVLLHQTLRQFIEQGAHGCAMEASSIGLAEHRLDGTDVDVAVLTNFTQDHLDYHGTMQAYWDAKRALFAWPGLRAAVLNLDDEHGSALAAELSCHDLDIWTVSCERPARLRATEVHYEASGLAFTLKEGGEQVSIQTTMVGAFNVINLLGVIAAMRALGVPLTEATQACANLLPVPGRMEPVMEGSRPWVVVDYAHTPDALDKALDALRPLAHRRGGQLWCVFGCGGGRDMAKRPMMGAIAERMADRVILTSDNPRHEKPQVILSQILRGFSLGEAAHVEPERARAIAWAIQAAAPTDVVLIAGKGHEQYQEVEGHRLVFSDVAHAQAALVQREAIAC